MENDFCHSDDSDDNNYEKQRKDASRRFTEFVVEEEAYARQKIAREMKDHVDRKVSCFFFHV